MIIIDLCILHFRLADSYDITEYDNTATPRETTPCKASSSPHANITPASKHTGDTPSNRVTSPSNRGASPSNRGTSPSNSGTSPSNTGDLPSTNVFLPLPSDGSLRASYNNGVSPASKMALTDTRTPSPSGFKQFVWVELRMIWRLDNLYSPTLCLYII